MSGVEFKTAQRAAECVVDAQGRRRYTAYYLAKMDDPADGPNKVLDYAEAHGVYWGNIYAYGNDINNTVFCDGLTPRRVPGSNEWWDLTVTWGAPDPESPMQDDDGNPTDEPNDWAWQHNMGYATWQEPVWAAYNRTAFPHPDQAGAAVESYTRGVGVYGPVVNSANVVLDPPLMRDMFDRVWQITTFSRTYNGSVSDVMMGAINSTAIRLSDYVVAKYGMTAQSFYAYQVKCTNASATHRILTTNEVRVPYWEWNWEFRIRQGLWLDSVLDRGITCRPKEGMPTGVHASPGDVLEAGVAPVIPVMDSAGNRVPELVLFDGAGYPMLPTDANYETGYYFDWQKDSAAVFTGLAFNFFDTV